MNLLKNQLLYVYLNGSIHVSLAVFALTQMTFYFCGLPFDLFTSLMVFSGTLFSYNFIKYASLIRSVRFSISPSLKVIVGLSLLALLVGTYSFLQLHTKAQLVTLGLLFLSVLYAIPISKKIPNLRNLAGLKVYIVCFCWAVVTVVVPVINASQELNLDILIKCVQRFILVLVLIGIFEIVDLQHDSLSLKTLPQQLGITTTKWFLSFLLLPFYTLEFFKIGYHSIQAWNNLAIVTLTLFFIWFATPKRTKFYTLFWVESIPIIWWLIIVFQQGTLFTQ
ncbi:UbiA prenyltransferase family protein [Myroides pelagicus]|uniref:Prenyltransferase n=1 Tax=Myroides pelagicus TaxID=270914 RepID=A0A7K1GIX9_9FLAO|nr:hypothetical protein [Myroides pelagicus]MEC4113766.1 hypothetical protein [Myroides pelagicus]MTH28776.1 hypothetical protein [Myroides pelagicus]